MKQIFIGLICMLIALACYRYTFSQKPLKIGYWTSWNLRCGIATYTNHLVNALERNGYSATIYSHTIPHTELAKLLKSHGITVLNIQYEPTIMPATEDLISTIKELSAFQIKVLLTIHRETEELKQLEPLVDGIIFHKPSNHFTWNKKCHYIPIGAPVFNPNNWQETRKKLGFSPSDIILTTCGFMMAWKEFPDILERLVPWLKSNKKHVIQLVTSYNDTCWQECNNENNKIKSIINKYALHDQVVHITDFLPQDALNERLWISDLGYLWGTIEVGASSAACKEFITSRLPLVVTNSSHYESDTGGMILVPKSKNVFVKTITETITKNDVLRHLRDELEKRYKQINYDVLVQRHIALLEKV